MGRVEPCPLAGVDQDGRFAASLDQRDSLASSFYIRGASLLIATRTPRIHFVLGKASEAYSRTTIEFGHRMNFMWMHILVDVLFFGLIFGSAYIVYLSRKGDNWSYRRSYRFVIVKVMYYWACTAIVFAVIFCLYGTLLLLGGRGDGGIFLAVGLGAALIGLIVRYFASWWIEWYRQQRD